MKLYMLAPKNAITAMREFTKACNNIKKLNIKPNCSKIY